MGSVGNFWKNLNGGTSNEKDEVKPEQNVDDNKKTSTTDEEIDALINSLEQAKKVENSQSKPQEKKSSGVAEIKNDPLDNETPISFNTDLFKTIAKQAGTNTNESAKTIKSSQKKEQTVQKNKKESQVDKVRETGKKATIITKSTIIAGNISTEDDLIIDGSVCGDVDCKGELTISGEVAGNAIAASINIKTSKFDGDVRSDGKIDINEGTVVLGNIYGESATIAGAVKGEIIVSNEAKLEPTAIVKGNIRAKSVQIEHGAVLQGFCELAYESMDLDDFFGEVEDEDEEETKTIDMDTAKKDEPQVDINDENEEAEEVEEDEEVSEIEPEEDEYNPEDDVEELELVEEQENKKEFMQEMENNYSNFMDQLKIDSE